jgi:hypothetical protein
VQAVAERHAPLVVLDKKEELFPMSAEDFIANCDLVWVTKPGKVTRVVDSVDPAHLAADAYTSPLAQWRGTTVAASFHTRPFDSRLRQPPGLPPRRGWALSLRDIATAVGTKSTAAQPDVYEGAPVYFEWTARDGHCYLTYWFCYAGSGLPFDVAEAVKATHDPGGALLTGAPDDASASSALQALAVAHPDLYKGATSAMREATDQQGELLLFRNPISGALDWVRDIIENKAPTLWKASGNPHFLCHQGDWESLSLELDRADLLGTPRGLVLFQHGKPSPVAWNDVEKVEADTRVRVYSAWGSHATLARPTHPATGDKCRPGQRWSTWTGKGVRDVNDLGEVEWYGFGGAWGAVGSTSDLTGPLGPTIWKNPFRV